MSSCRSAAIGGKPRGMSEMEDLRKTLTLEPIEKWKFYEAVATPDHVLTIQTADQQRYVLVRSRKTASRTKSNCCEWRKSDVSPMRM